MKKFLLPLITLFLFQGCVTMVNNSDTVIALRSSEPARFIIDSDTLSKREQRRILNLPLLSPNASPQEIEGIKSVMAEIDSGYLAFAQVPRSRKRLNVTVENDSISVDFQISPRITGAIATNIFWFPISLCIDLASNRTRNYHSQYIDLDAGTVSSFATPARLIPQMDYGRDMCNGNGYFTLGWPLATLMHYQGPRETTDYGGGMFGLSLGGEYYFRDKRSLGLELSGMFGFDWQFDANMGLFLAHHHRRFSVGYGINFTHTWWDSDFWSDTDCDYDGYYHDYDCEYGDSEHTWAMGPMVNAYYWPNPNISIGITYRPTLLRLGNTTDKNYAYGHNISLDLRFHMGGRKKSFTARRKPRRFA